jgi:hypothetical protein
MRPRDFFAELKRRNVYKVAVAYAVVGWVIAQISTQIFPFLEIPNWVVRLVIVLIAIGFPIALVIAWAFEATPEGIKRTEVADAMPAVKERKQTHVDLRRRNRRRHFGRAVLSRPLHCSASTRCQCGSHRARDGFTGKIHRSVAFR